MPVSEHPVTLGDLRYEFQNRQGRPTFDLRLATRKATVADLVSALRAEGVLVVEKVDGEWPTEVIAGMAGTYYGARDQGWDLTRCLVEMLDGLAEVQR